MITQINSEIISLGNEPSEVLGFKNEEELEAALLPLLEDVISNANIAA